MKVRNTLPQSAQPALASQADSVAIVPDPSQFRAWVQDCIVLLSVSAGSVSREIGAGKNTVSQFLSDPERGVDLRTAHKITSHFRALAAERSLALPRATWAEGCANV